MRLFDWHCDTVPHCVKHGETLEHNTMAVDYERGAIYDEWVQMFAIFLDDRRHGDAAWEYGKYLLDGAKTLVRPPHRLAVENGVILGGDLSRIEVLKSYDLAYLTLTWNGSNELGNGCFSGCEDGLTPLGQKAITLFEEADIPVDTAHLNRQGFSDVQRFSKRPFITTHTAANAVHENPRNLSDDQFRAVRDAGGIVGIDLCADHLGEQSFAGIERHLSHFLSLDGEKTVVLGGDLDGTDIPNKWQGICLYKDLYAYLLQHGYGEDLLDAVFFRNSIDFFKRYTR